MPVTGRSWCLALLFAVACIAMLAGCSRPTGSGGVEGDDADAVYQRAADRLTAGDFDGAARSMTEFVTRWPALVDRVPMELMYPVALRGDGFPVDRTTLQQALFDMGWDGGDGQAGGVWVQLATARLVAGDREAARVVLARVADPVSLAVMRSDRRFDGLYDDRDWIDRVVRAAGDEVRRLRRRVASREDPLAARIQLGYALLQLARYDEVLALADEGLRDLDASDRSDGTVVDGRVWLLNHLADAMLALGRYDEAVEVLRGAGAVDEYGAPNVSQRLNLGNLLCRLGRLDEAAIANDVVDAGLSDYGKAFRAYTRQCIALSTGDVDAARRAVDEIASHGSDARRLHLMALVAADRDDEAVRLARSMLDAPDERQSLLDWMQAYDELPPFPNEVALRRKLDAFRVRRDLLAAIEPVGRVERYPLQRGVR